MKKLTVMFLILLLLFPSVLAEDEPQAKETCEHLSVEKRMETIDPCVGPVYMHAICTICGKELETREYPAPGHDFVKTVINEATCAAEGYARNDCRVCGAVEYITIPKSDRHTFSDWEILEEATCSKYGRAKRHCVICGFEEEEPIPSDSTWHVMRIEIGEPATPTKPGTYCKVCEVCGFVSGWYHYKYGELDTGAGASQATQIPVQATATPAPTSTAAPGTTNEPTGTKTPDPAKAQAGKPTATQAPPVTQPVTPAGLSVTAASLKFVRFRTEPGGLHNAVRGDDAAEAIEAIALELSETAGVVGMDELLTSDEKTALSVLPFREELIIAASLIGMDMAHRDDLSEDAATLLNTVKSRINGMDQNMQSKWLEMLSESFPIETVDMKGQKVIVSVIYVAVPELGKTIVEKYAFHLDGSRWILAETAVSNL